MDKGYTQISNQIIDAIIRCRLSGAQTAVVLYVLRKTVGWNKPSDRISISRMAKDIGIQRHWCSLIVKDLQTKGILLIDDGEPRLGVHEMQLLDPENWDKTVQKNEHVHKNVHVQKNEQGCSENCTPNCSENCTESVQKNEHTKYINTTKDTITKDRLSTSLSEDDDEGYTVEEYLRMIGAGDGTL